MYKAELKKELNDKLIDLPLFQSASSIFELIKQSANEKVNNLSRAQLYLLLNQLQDEQFLKVEFNRDLHPKRFPIKIYSLTTKTIKK